MVTAREGARVSPAAARETPAAPGTIDGGSVHRPGAVTEMWTTSGEGAEMA